MDQIYLNEYRKFRVGFWHNLGNLGINWEANTDEILYEEDGINCLKLKVAREYQEDVTDKCYPQFPYKPNHHGYADISGVEYDDVNWSTYGWYLSTGVARIDYSAAHAINVNWNRSGFDDYPSILAGKILSGDTIEIKGRRRTVASVAPIIPRDQGDRKLDDGDAVARFLEPFVIDSKFKSLTTKQKKAKCFIRMDHFIRENAGVKIGDSVAVKKIEDWIMADTVSIAPWHEIQPMDERYFAEALENQPFILGQNFMIPYFRGVLCFQIIGATPNAGHSGCYRVGEKTFFTIAERGYELKSYDVE